MRAEKQLADRRVIGKIGGPPEYRHGSDEGRRPCRLAVVLQVVDKGLEVSRTVGESARILSSATEDEKRTYLADATSGPHGSQHMRKQASIACAVPRNLIVPKYEASCRAQPC